MRNNQHRNITLSTKVSALQKAELVKIAQSHDISLSEFILSIVDTYKHKYGKENEPSKNELKLKEENDSLKKKNIRLLKDRESADYRVGLEMKRADKAVDERDEYRYRLKETMVENHTLYQELLKYKPKFDKSKSDKQSTRILLALLGAILFAGRVIKG
jgi:hypothetical protein